MDNTITAIINDDFQQAHPAQFQALLDHLVMTMGDDKQMIETWLKTPKKELENKAPIEFLHASEHAHLDAQRVISLLRKILEQDSRIG
ncbi:hypothetical protein PN836_012630 [Ningiella sp. W23]|uniref:hypothetical protein n=1 Tax=Ningiella sp. W23 TaxID=3023715 RepID=UPI003756F0A0